MSTTAQTEFLSSLSDTLSITDVYFWQGKLMVVNDYDVTKIEEFLNKTKWANDISIMPVSNIECAAY